METIKNADSKYYSLLSLTDFFSFDICPYVTIVRFESGEKIMTEGAIPADLYYLIDGRAKLFLSHENGRKSLINFIHAPCFIGEMELLGAQKTSNEIISITPCTCYAINMSSCREQLLNDTKFLRHICLYLSQKAICNTENYSHNQSYPLETRLADFILLTAQNRYYRECHTEVAEYLGVTYRHLLYVLSGFARKGILQRTKQGYYIADNDALIQLAKPRIH